MTRECRIAVNGETLVPDRSGALWWPAEKTLVVADLHFEKGSAFARGGQLLPPYDTRATLRRLQEAAGRFKPARVIALGDSFHDGKAEARLDDEERTALKAMAGRCDWLWVEGNHDPEPPAWAGGMVAREIAIGGLTFRHKPHAKAFTGEVAGHLHPVATVSGRGMRVRRRCFVSDGVRLVLPAFGAYTGGLDVREAAIASLFADGFAVYAMGREKVYAVGGAAHRLRKKSDEVQPRKIAIKTVTRP